MPRVHLAAFAIALYLAAPASATWSIVVADPSTGEVAVGTATCIGGGDIQNIVPVLRVGYGVVAHQANVFMNFPNKLLSWQQLKLETDPDVMLQLIDAQDGSFQSRQIGIVDLHGRAATHTGAGNGAWAGGLIGSQGTMVYAIQGNVLTGEPVVKAAEDALLATPGAIPEKLMAAMEAARKLGGDGRCSCSTLDPTGCGSPPPQFDKSAIIGAMVVARIGDTDGTCMEFGGCTNGSYYMNFNVSGPQAGLPDPVIQMQAQYDAWRASLVGHADHLESKASPGAAVLAPGGAAVAKLTIQARDWQGNPVGHGGATVTVVKEHESDNVLQLSPNIIDLGDGTYTIAYKSKATLGRDVLKVTIDDGQGPVVLYPFTEIAVADPSFLKSDVTQISASAGDDVPLDLDAGSGLAGRDYLVLATLSGTDPGVVCGALHIPLNPDPVTFATIALCNSYVLQNTCGVLDENGRAQAALSVAPGDLAGMVSSTMHFAAVTVAPEDFASAPIAVSILP